MSPIAEYIARGGRGGEVSKAEIEALLKRCEWFTTGRIILEHITGRPDPIVRIVTAGRCLSSLAAGETDLAAVKLPQQTEAESADEIIERFLKSGGHRIVADAEADDDGDVRTEAEFEDEDDLVSEELAEIYLSQGLKPEALKIYRKLSLLNTKKSVYFAEIIDKIENNN